MQRQFIALAYVLDDKPFLAIQLTATELVNPYTELVDRSKDIAKFTEKQIIETAMLPRSPEGIRRPMTPIFVQLPASVTIQPTGDPNRSLVSYPLGEALTILEGNHRARALASISPQAVVTVFVPVTTDPEGFVRYLNTPV